MRSSLVDIRDEKAYFEMNQREPALWDLSAIDLKEGLAEPLHENDGLWSYEAIVDEGTVVAVREDVPGSSNLYVLRLGGEATTVLPPTENKRRVSVHGVLRKERTVFFSTDEGSEFLRVWSYGVDDGELRMRFASDGDIVDCELAGDGERVLLTVARGEDARQELVDLTTGDVLPWPSLEAPVHRAEFAQGSRELFLWLGDLGERLVLFDEASGQTVPIGEVRTSSTPALIQPETVRFASFDDTLMSGLLYTPESATSTAPAPLLLFTHGGPGGVFSGCQSSVIQYLVHRGFAVFALNNRGSSRFGKTFEQLDDGRHGEDDLEDCLVAKKVLSGRPRIDAARAGIVGLSYGGFLVLRAAIDAPDAFQAGATLFGLVDWEAALDAPFWSERQLRNTHRELGDLERLARMSPLAESEQIRMPLLLVQGTADPRVDKSQGDALIEKIESRGGPVESLALFQAGHFYASRSQWCHLMRRVAGFFDRRLTTE